MTSIDDAAAAKRLARSLVEHRSAACVQIVPATAVYTWNGEIVEAAEQLLVIKTTDAAWDDVVSLLRAEHPYDTPELVRVEVTGGLPDYLDWVVRSTSG